MRELDDLSEAVTNKPHTVQWACAVCGRVRSLVSCQLVEGLIVCERYYCRDKARRIDADYPAPLMRAQRKQRRARKPRAAPVAAVSAEPAAVVVSAKLPRWYDPREPVPPTAEARAYAAAAESWLRGLRRSPR